MNTIIVKADSKITKALVSIFEAFGVSFEIQKEPKEHPYNQEFVEKILSRSKNAKSGNTTVYNEELKKELFEA